MAGQLGNKKNTILNLVIVKILPEENTILVKGSVPGHDGSNVIIKPTKKKYILKEILTPEKKSEEKSNPESHQPKEAAKEVESKSDEVVKEKKVNTQQTETQE